MCVTTSSDLMGISSSQNKLGSKLLEDFTLALSCKRPTENIKPENTNFKVNSTKTEQSAAPKALLQSPPSEIKKG